MLPAGAAVWDPLMCGACGEGCGLMGLEGEDTGRGHWSGCCCEHRAWAAAGPCDSFREAAVHQALGR